jgi:DNA-binding NtrC family response regulator
MAANIQTVLVIDDDAQVLDILRRFIEANNGRALLAENTEAGLVLARNGQVDLILLDIVLPDEDGLAALRKIRAILPNVPVIMMTGHDKLDMARECLKLGARDFITKPFDFEYLKTSMLANIFAR